MRRRAIAIMLTVTMAAGPAVVSTASSKVKLRGYVTAKSPQSLSILDDIIYVTPGTELRVENGEASSAVGNAADVAIGTLVQAEGTWTGKHQFAAEKITYDQGQFAKEIHSAAFLEREPSETEAISAGRDALLKVDGEMLLLAASTRRDWKVDAGAAATPVPVKSQSRFLGRQVRYEGVRQADGRIDARKIELAPPAPADAYKIPGDRTVGRTQDAQTKIEILEMRKGTKVEGRMKLFPEKEVQEYVRDLGYKLLPPSTDATIRAVEFRFFVVEDPHINAASLPDGTILVNTGLLAAMDNESQLAFVLSHEIAHVLQAHYWREVHETRSKRVLITLGAIAGAYFVGDVALFLGQLGLASVVNGYSRGIENQADRIALQSVIDNGYDPRTSVRFFRTMIDRYGDRSTSALWSNHESSLLRGSFLTVQLSRQYPDGKFDNGIVDTEKFKAMKSAMGPMKIM